MKLTDEIRNLRGRKQMLRDRRLHDACHEASHAVMALHHGHPFTIVLVGDETVGGQRLRGRLMLASGRVYTDTAIPAAKVALAGHCFNRIVNPHVNDAVLGLLGTMGDLRMAIDCVKFWAGGDDAQTEFIIFKSIVPQVHKFLIENWETILRIGTALAARGKLSYAEVKKLAATKSTAPRIKWLEKNVLDKASRI